MEEKDVKAKILCLKEIKPKEDWVFLTRRRLSEEFSNPSLSPLQNKGFWGIFDGVVKAMTHLLERPAFVIPVLAVLVSGGAMWQTTQSSLPGDVFYPIKTVAEQVPSRFSGNIKEPLRQIELTQKRLAELRVAAEQNRTKNLSPAIEAFQVKVSDVSNSVEKIVENQPEYALQAGREIVQLQKEKLAIEKILGTKIGGVYEDDLVNATKKVVEHELADLENRLLTEDQNFLLEEAKIQFSEGNDTEALEKIWMISNEG
jgi:hypothetical protein